MIIFETGAIIFVWKTIRALMHEMMEILNDRQLKKLAEHKYKRDGDYTLLEPYLQPFWNWTVEKCPLWWAPNAITFIGLLINIATALLIILYNPDGKQQAPSWAYILAAIGVFVYQTLDSIDGKQARRTNSSSPLGELFDHGCDAVSAVILGVASLIHLRLPNDILMILVCGSYLGFYLAHWLTYCIGALSFGKFDVVEIHFIMITGFIVSAACGEEIWLSEVPVLGLQLNMLLAIFVIIGGIYQTLPALHTILIKGGVGRNGSTVADTSIIFPALPISTVIALTYVIAWKSELSGDLYNNYPAMYLISFGWVFAKIACKVIIAHMCKSELEYWDSIYVGPALLFMNQYFDFFVPERYVLWASFIYNLINLIHYSHAVSSQICQHMGIYCFSISKRHPPKTAHGSSSTSRHKSSTNGNSEVNTRQHSATKRKGKL